MKEKKRCGQNLSHHESYGDGKICDQNLSHHESLEMKKGFVMP
jgi:hypothetical protein